MSSSRLIVHLGYVMTYMDAKSVYEQFHNHTGISYTIVNRLRHVCCQDNFNRGRCSHVHFVIQRKQQQEENHEDIVVKYTLISLSTPLIAYEK